MEHSVDEGRRRFVLNTLATGAILLPTLPRLGFSAQDQEKRAQAQHIMVFGSPYDSALAQYSPHMHASFKSHVERLSGGKIYVDIQDNGSAGIGTELMAKVTRGKIASALVSVSNLSPASPALDVLNIPFWSATNQQYINLVTSKSWQQLVINPIKAKGNVEVLFHYVPGPRTLTTTRLCNKIIKTPEDAKNLTFRVPASKVLAIYYHLAGIRPVNVAWKDVALLARKGRIDALDPGIIGLYNGPDDLREDIGAISLVDSVQDGWVAVASQNWLKGLSIDLKEALYAASQLTFEDHLQQVVQVTDLCGKALVAKGTTIYTPSKQEKAVWIERCGHTRPEWRAVKQQLLGNEKHFDALLAATKINNGYEYLS